MEWTEKATREVPVLNLRDHRNGAPLPRPAIIYEATADDGVTLTVAVAGSGKGTDPWALQIRALSPDGPEGEARFPTLEEIQTAVNAFTLRGAILSAGSMMSGGPDATVVPPVGFGSFTLAQTGAGDDTPAAMRLLLSGGVRATPGPLDAPGGADA